MKEFLEMGGYALYVWTSYGLALIVLAVPAHRPGAPRLVAFDQAVHGRVHVVLHGIGEQRGQRCGCVFVRYRLPPMYIGLAHTLFRTAGTWCVMSEASIPRCPTWLAARSPADACTTTPACAACQAA